LLISPGRCCAFDNAISPLPRTFFRTPPPQNIAGFGNHPLPNSRPQTPHRSPPTLWPSLRFHAKNPDFIFLPPFFLQSLPYFVKELYLFCTPSEPLQWTLPTFNILTCSPCCKKTVSHPNPFCSLSNFLIIPPWFVPSVPLPLHRTLRALPPFVLRFFGSHSHLFLSDLSFYGSLARSVLHVEPTLTMTKRFQVSHFFFAFWDQTKPFLPLYFLTNGLFPFSLFQKTPPHPAEATFLFSRAPPLAKVSTLG